MSESEEHNKNIKIKQQRDKFVRRLIICVLLILAITIIYVYVNKTASGTSIDFGTFKEQLWAGNIQEIDLNQTKIQIYYKNGEAHWLYRRDSIESDIIEEWNKLAESGITPPTLISGTTTIVSILDILYPILLVGTLIFAVVMVVRQVKSSNNKNFEFVKSRARIYPSKTKFSDVAGADEEKKELEDVVDFLKNPKKYTELGAKIPKGVILVGPPGTGKTLLARAVAGEANVPFFTISGSDFMELFVGVGASRVRDLFETAKKSKPCIIFIDEIDAVGRQRGAGLGGGNDEREQTLNQLLVQMDGFEENEGVIVIAATNRVDILDPALLRPGRFDRRINIGVPDIKGREEILKVHAKNKKFSKSIDFKTIARITSGFTGAELENLLNEAAIMVAKENRKFINEEDIQQAIMKVTLGPQKRSRVIDEKDKYDTAIHESGHALISKLAKEKSPVHEVSIIPRGGAGGYTVSTDDDSTVYFKEKLLCKIQMLLGGITAEKLYVGDISTGASNDLKRATSIARRMVTEWGMSSEVGMVYCGSDDAVFIGKTYQERIPYSETQGTMIDAEVKKIIDVCQQETERILTENKDILMTMANVLLERETIYAEEVDMIIEGKSKEEVVSYIDNKDNKESSNSVENSSNFVDDLIKNAENKEKKIAEQENIVSKNANSDDAQTENAEISDETSKTVEEEKTDKSETKLEDLKEEEKTDTSDEQVKENRVISTDNGEAQNETDGSKEITTASESSETVKEETETPVEVSETDNSTEEVITASESSETVKEETGMPVEVSETDNSIEEAITASESSETVKEETGMPVEVSETNSSIEEVTTASENSEETSESKEDEENAESDNNVTENEENVSYEKSSKEHNETKKSSKNNKSSK